MRKWFVTAALLAVALTASSALASTSLQNVLVNINGTTQFNLAGFNTASFNMGTGQGTLTYTFNGPAGSYYFDILFDHDLATPFFNEYGQVNGSPAAGTTYSIDDYQDNSGSPTPGSGAQTNANDAYDQVLGGGALQNNNLLPGTQSNFDTQCTADFPATPGNCNGDVAAALGFSFTLDGTDQELITFNIGTSNPGGFSLQLIHPADSNNRLATNLFITGSAVSQPIGNNPPPTVPEPASLMLLGTGMTALATMLRRMK
jgi:hypothetical protein